MIKGLRRLEPLVLWALGAVAFLAWSFQEIAEEVLEGDTHGIDAAILLGMRNPSSFASPWGPAWFPDMMRDFSSLGSTGVLSLIILCATLYLLIVRKVHRAFYMLVTTVTGTVLSSALKAGFDRPRPDLVPHGAMIYTASFPSGHSMMAAVVYLTLGALLAQAQDKMRVKAFLMGVAVFLTVLVGISRVYLGVHWPSDVLAGWVMGALWALGFWTIERIWVRRRHIP